MSTDTYNTGDSLVNTDCYRNLNSRRVELTERLNGLRSNLFTFTGHNQYERTEYWIAHWEKERSAVITAMKALEGEQ